MAQWCEDCYEPSRTPQCEDCRREQRRERDLDALDQQMAEVLNDCG